MFWNNSVFQEKYYQFFYRLFQFHKLVKIKTVDFNKPWWFLLSQRKFAVFLDFFSQASMAVFESVTPLILGMAIFSRSLEIMIYFVVFYMVLQIINRLIMKITAVYVLEIEHNIAFSAYQYFLTVDPIFHTTKSSGQILSKIERASKDYSDMINLFMGGIIPVVSGFVAVSVTLSAYNVVLGLVGITSFVVIAIVNSFASFINSKTFQKFVIKIQDKRSAITTENLQQNSLIRSSFATIEQSNKTKKLFLESLIVRTTSWFGHDISNTITRVLYILASFALSVLILNLVKENTLKPEIGLTLLIAFVNGSTHIQKLGRTIKDVTEKYVSVVDLFTFIQGFGKQTYPVLEGELINNE